MPSILKKVPIPKNSSSEISQRVISIAKDLVKAEYQHLETETVLAANLLAAQDNKEDIDPWLKNLAQRVDEHNQTSNNLMAEIDKCFFEMLNLSSKEIQIISDGLKANKFAVFTQ